MLLNSEKQKGDYNGASEEHLRIWRGQSYKGGADDYCKWEWGKELIKEYTDHDRGEKNVGNIEIKT
jgi:hypothetical protein